MKISIHRFLSWLFLFLTISSQSTFAEFTDSKQPKTHLSNNCPSFFDLTRICRKESSETIKNMPLRDAVNLARGEGFDVDSDTSYVMAITTIIAQITQRTLDATTAIPLAIINAYKNRKLYREEQELLEYEFDQIDQMINRKSRPDASADKFLKNNTVYSVAAIPAAVTAGAAIVEAVIVAASASVINNRSEEQKVKQKQEQKQGQPQKQSEKKVAPKKATKETAKKAAKKTVKEVAQKDSTQETSKESIQKDIVFLPSDTATNAQENAEVAHSNATKAAVKACDDQRAHDRKVRDNAVNATILVGASFLQQYDQQQKVARKQQIREECIQERMKTENKSRWQIEEEIRLEIEKYEQERIEERQRQQREQEEAKKQKRERKQKNKDKEHKGFDPYQDPDKDPNKRPDPKKIVAATVVKKTKDNLDRANKNKPSLQKNSKNCRPSQENIRKDQCSQNQYTNGKGVYESNPKHHPNASKGIAQEAPRPLEALKDSLYVDAETRVAIQDGKIIMLRKHGKTTDGFPIYHSYIEKDIHRVNDAKTVLSNARLIHPKTGRVLKR